MSNMLPKLTIQILGFNGANDLPRAVGALKNIPREEAVIRYIDNGSTDGSAEIVRQVLPHADVIERGVNTGFAGGNNFGFSLCSTPFVLIQNPDVTIDWQGVQELLKAFDDPKVGAVQGKLYRKSQTPMTNDQVLDSVGIVQTIALNGRERGAGEEDRGQFEEPTQLLAVTGGCALYRMEALRTISAPGAEMGLNLGEVFDENFFAYKEDVDLGWRLSNAGWKCLYVPVRMGWHARTMKREGVLNWGLNPKRIFARLKNRRTRMSLRNYCWMIAKNASSEQIILRSPFIAARLLVFFIFSLAYSPLLGVWTEIVGGLPRALAKRG